MSHQVSVMSTIWAFRSLARAAVVAGFPKPGGVHLHANLSNLAACSFSAQRLKYPKEQTEKDSLSEKTLQSEGTENKDKTEDKPLSIFQRFKKAYKEHGKILVCVHIATSTVWFGSFYYAAKTGFDIVPLLEKWNFSETVIKPFKSSGLGNIAVAYLMYKLATPARYTVTLGGTNLCIKYFRKTGKMPPKAEDSLREIYKDGRDRFQERKKNVTSQLRQKRLKAVEKAKLKRRKH
ncbi:hypothetical protein KUTeg_019948 [Tegillarca granosa]|uniref:DUF1279 domain-containing protein n=1 Tax=Tegillarca granosa TaxID=220873 RepID=A0ABQ9EJ11_TEGGR|nr:hypothetical protein KUTeg_019948 [Tegillarca granosa]